MTIYPPIPNPEHPGKKLRELMEQRPLTEEELSSITGLYQSNIHNILAGSASISPAIAAKLQKVGLGTTKEWKEMQDAYDDVNLYVDYKFYEVMLCATTTVREKKFLSKKYKETQWKSHGLNARYIYTDSPQSAVNILSNGELDLQEARESIRESIEVYFPKAEEVKYSDIEFCIKWQVKDKESFQWYMENATYDQFLKMLKRELPGLRK